MLRSSLWLAIILEMTTVRIRDTCAGYSFPQGVGVLWYIHLSVGLDHWGFPFLFVCLCCCFLFGCLFCFCFLGGGGVGGVISIHLCFFLWSWYSKRLLNFKYFWGMPDIPDVVKQ